MAQLTSSKDLVACHELRKCLYKGDGQTDIGHGARMELIWVELNLDSLNKQEVTVFKKRKFKGT